MNVRERDYYLRCPYKSISRFGRDTVETLSAITLLDSATKQYEFQMKECHPPIITESEFRVVQDERKMKQYCHR